jgi:hypothetical protein
MREARLLTFLSCRQLRRIHRTNPPEYTLSAPSINWWSDTYPASVPMGIFIEFTGADGAYTPRIEVHDDEGEPLGCLVEGAPFVSKDPITVHCMALEQTAFQVPQPGHYDLVLFFNGEEAARRQLWVLPEQGRISQ